MKLDEFVGESKKHKCKLCERHPKIVEIEDGLSKGYPLNTISRWTRAEGCFVGVGTLTKHRDHIK